MAEFPRIVFYGTPHFAVPSLEALVKAGYSPVCVVTAPDKPAGRGLKLMASPVKETALAMDIPVMQPVSLKDKEFLVQLRCLHPDLQIVIAFRMMPREVWSMPPLGTFNLHASLLPQYRGAAPIQRAVMNGETETGLTTFLLNDRIDEGGILLTAKVSIGPAETAGELHDRMMETGGELVIRTVAGLLSNTLRAVPQSHLAGSGAELKTAPKIFREDCRIDWNRTTQEVFNFIRGLAPWPGAFTEITLADGTKHVLKIFGAHQGEADGVTGPGNFITDTKSFLMTGTKDGCIYLDILQLAGRKTMNVAEFLRGFSHLFTETHGI